MYTPPTLALTACALYRWILICTSTCRPTLRCLHVQSYSHCDAGVRCNVIFNISRFPFRAGAAPGTPKSPTKKTCAPHRLHVSFEEIIFARYGAPTYLGRSRRARDDGTVPDEFPMMSSTNEEDPFLQVQRFVLFLSSAPDNPKESQLTMDLARVFSSDVLNQLNSTRSLFTSFLRIRSLAKSPSSEELASVRSDLEASVETLSEDLADLQDAVEAVESNPAQFGLSQEEVNRRKRLVQEVRGEIEDMQGEMKKKTVGGTSSGSDLPDPSSFSLQEGDDDAYQEFEQQQQQQIMREQDEQLDGVSATVGNLRRQADDMGRELEEQRQILEVVDDAAERVGSRLQTGMQKLNHIVRRNEDRFSSCCIAVLIFVLILLLVLLLIV